MCDLGWDVGGRLWAFIEFWEQTPFTHMHTYTHYPIAHRKHQLDNQRKHLSLHLFLSPYLPWWSLSFPLRPSMTAVPWNARPRRWATAGLGVAIETKEGQTTTTWSVYPRRGGLPDMDTGEKTGVIGRLRGPSVATRRLTQVGKTTYPNKVSPLKLKCIGTLCKELSTFERLNI